MDVTVNNMCNTLPCFGTFGNVVNINRPRFTSLLTISFLFLLSSSNCWRVVHFKISSHSIAATRCLDIVNIFHGLLIVAVVAVCEICGTTEGCSGAVGFWSSLVGVAGEDDDEATSCTFDVSDDEPKPPPSAGATLLLGIPPKLNVGDTCCLVVTATPPKLTGAP